jgi:TonB family protein
MNKVAADILTIMPPVLPDTSDAKSINKEWSLKKIKVGGVEMVRASRRTGSASPVGLPDTEYFFDPQMSSIRAQQWINEAVFYNDLHPALGRVVPFTVTLKTKDKHSTEMKISDFSDPGNPPDAALQIPGATKFDASTDAVLVVSPRELHAIVVKNVAPVYPEIARANRASGDVELQLTIGQDGQLRDVKVLRATSLDFANSAVTEVHTNAYKPYILNGVPTSVTSTTEIHYRIN